MKAIGSHFLVGLSSTKLLPEERDILKELAPSGIILFRKNISTDLDWREGVADLLADVSECIGRSKIIFGVDHEGGKVHRLPEPVTRFPAAAHWGEKIEEVALQMSKELLELGFNTGFSPVLDVHSRPENPVIGERAFSSDPFEVAAKGQRFIAALHQGGLLSCGKHFPGHGDTTVDSHFELPVVQLSKDELLRREVIPFKAAIDGGVDMIMTAHVHYPALDQHNPATLSPLIIDGLLRQELGFSGVVISDDLQMKALSHITPGEIAVKCLLAGVDLLLVGNVNEESPLVRALKMAEAIERSLDRGELQKAELEVSRARIEKLLSTLSN